MNTYEKQTLLTLDYWQDKVIYMGNVLPAGAVACAALNISDKTLSALEPIFNKLEAVNSKAHPTAEEWLSTKNLVMQEMELLKDLPPYCYLDLKKCRSQIDDCYIQESISNMMELSNVLASMGPLGVDTERYSKGLRFANLLLFSAMLIQGIKQYREGMLPFAEELDHRGRKPEDYAELFGKFFPLQGSYDVNGTQWMGIKNISVQHIAVDIPEAGTKQIVMRMLCASFAGMLRQDLFEGLRVGHAPKKCPICGRWFLTTNAKQTKYCGGIAPNDPLGRTCRLIANKQGRAAREKAEDNPINTISRRVIANIDQQVHRGKMNYDMADKLKRLAREKRLQALNSCAYAQGSYESEMTVDALMAEACL